MEVLITISYLAAVCILVFDVYKRLKKLEEFVAEDKPTDNVSKFRGADGLFKRKKE